MGALPLLGASGCHPEYDTAQIVHARETTGTVSMTEAARGKAWAGRQPLGLLSKFTAERPHLEVRWFEDDTELYLTWWNPMSEEPESRQLLRHDLGFQPVAVDGWEAGTLYAGGNMANGLPRVVRLDLGRFDDDLSISSERLLVRLSHVTDLTCSTENRLALLDTTARTVSLLDVETEQTTRLLDAGALPEVSEMQTISVGPSTEPGHVSYLLSRHTRRHVLETGTGSVDMILRDDGDDGQLDAFEVH